MAGGSEGREARPSRQRSILLVDDDEGVLDVTALGLDFYWRKRRRATASWSIYKAQTVHAASRILESLPLNVVLSDWDMPDGGGRFLIPRARCPVVIYSGAPWSAYTSEERMLIEARAAGWFQKPTPINVLALELLRIAG